MVTLYPDPDFSCIELFILFLGYFLVVFVRFRSFCRALDMAPYYETLAADKVVGLDQSLLDAMCSKNEEEVKKLDEK